MATTTVTNGEVNLFVNDDGEGEAVILLHGWPDTSALWDEVAPLLVARGHRVVVPDLRGCGRSDKPEDLGAYAMSQLVADVVAILDALGIERAHVVGHDWGANLAWVLASYVPERLHSLSVLSVGHPTSFRSAGLDQQIRSWYTLLFFHEGVGEAFLRANDYEAMRTWLKHPRVESVIAELERDGQMAAHLKWYRRNIPPAAFVSPPPVLPPITVPVLGIWSSGDLALCEHQMTNSEEFCEAGFTYVRLEEHGHWLPLEVPEVVANTIGDFIASR